MRLNKIIDDFLITKPTQKIEQEINTNLELFFEGKQLWWEFTVRFRKLELKDFQELQHLYTKSPQRHQ